MTSKKRVFVSRPCKTLKYSGRTGVTGHRLLSREGAAPYLAFDIKYEDPGEIPDDSDPNVDLRMDTTQRRVKGEDKGGKGTTKEHPHEGNIQ